MFSYWHEFVPHTSKLSTMKELKHNMVVSNRIVSPTVSPVKRDETNTSPATVQTDRAIRLALAAQRHAMQEAMRKSEAAR